MVLESGWPVFPAPLVKEIVFSSLYILTSFVEDKVSIGVWIYLWAFYFVPLIYISVFVPVPYCLDDWFCSRAWSQAGWFLQFHSSFSRLLWLFEVFCISIQIVKLFVLALWKLPLVAVLYNVLFIIRDWNAKVGSQETPGITGKSGLGIWNEAGQRLIEFCQENTPVIANTLFQQHKRRIYTGTSPDGQHQIQIDYILWSQRWRSSIQSAKPRPGADCGSDHELLNWRK